MKTLQCHFTTPEQSERLMELGVPRWTADEYRDIKGFRHSLEGILDVELYFQNFPEDTPCWSAGRLMEIFDICFPESDTACWPPCYELDTDYINYVIHLYERGIIELDFSKLED